MKQGLSVVLIIALTFSLCLVGASSAASTTEEDLLGTVSAKYESNGNPGIVSSGSGDIGGASFGAYQFAGNSGVPLAFAKWCVSSGKGVATGNRLTAAYTKDGNTFGTNFKAEWQALAKENSAAFLKLQHDYVKTQYYDRAVKALKTYLNLDVEQYGIAFKNAVWSRSVQHGVGKYDADIHKCSGFLDVMRAVEIAKGGSLAGCKERDLLKAVYEESGAVRTTGTNPMNAASAGGNAWIITKYGLEGKYMKYFSGNSGAVQAGVYLRLRVNEYKDVMDMYEKYGSPTPSTPDDPGTPIPPDPPAVLPVASGLSGDTPILCDCDTLTGFGDITGGTLSAVTSGQKQGKGAVSILPAGSELSFTLTPSAQLPWSVYKTLVFQLYLPADQPENTTASLELGVRLVPSFNGVGTVALKGLTAGWHTVTYAFPSADAAARLEQICFTFSGLTEADQKNGFRLDYVCSKVAVPETAFHYAKVTASALNCRSTPSTDGKSFGLYGKDTRVITLGTAVNGWYYCVGKNNAGKTMAGWCSGEYLTLSAYVARERDLNGDGATNAADALQILKYAVGKAQFSEEAKALADVNHDGRADASDALKILRFAVGKD